MMGENQTLCGVDDRWSCELISTEDKLAKAEIVKEDTKGWQRCQYWEDMECEDYIAYGECWDRNKSALCSCKDNDDGIDENGRFLAAR